MANPQQKSNREHSFDSELASLVGIEKAILLKNISYWVDENERKKLESSFAYGKWWTFESLTSLAKKYPYMKRGNLSRWFKELKQDKWILMFSTTDGANMYTPGPVFNSWNLGQDWQGVFQNETGRKWGEVFQNETKAEFQNETKGAAQNETHNNVEKDVEKNVELEGEREAEKTTPTLEDVIEEIKNRNAETRDVEAKKEKAPSISGGFPKLDISEEIDELKNGVIRRGNSNPTHTVKTTDTSLPGVLIIEGVNLEPTNPTPAARILNGVNRAPLAEDSDGAQKLIMAWATNGALETVQNWYNLARRKFTPEDLELMTARFCSTYSTAGEASKRMLFFADPVLFFKNKARVFIDNQKSFDRMNEPKNGFVQQANQAAEARTGMYRKITNL